MTRNLQFLRTRPKICEIQNPEVAQNWVFPRENFNLSDIANPKVAQNLVSPRENFNPRSSGNQNKWWIPKAAQIKVFPRNYFDLSNFGTSELSNLEILGSFCWFGWPRIEVFPWENSILSNFRICKVPSWFAIWRIRKEFLPDLLYRGSGRNPFLILYIGIPYIEVEAEAEEGYLS